jgi:hypothetical protein
MRSWILACWLQAAIVLPLSPGQTVGIAKYPYPGGVVSVYFDPANVTRAELDSWMRLSPDLSPYNDLLVAIDIRRCLPGDRQYTDCKTEGSLRIANVDENIRKMTDIKRSLIVQKEPDDLRPIVAYLSEIQSFGLWAARQQRAFLLTRNVSVLRDRYDGLASNDKCDAVLQKIERPAKETDITNLVTVDWHNCVWALETEKVGPYPKKEWQAFLTSRGIREEVKEEVPDN